MKSKYSFLKVISWLLVGIWLTHSLLFRLINIEYASMEITRNMRLFWLIILPICLVIITLKSKNSRKPNFKKFNAIVLSFSITIAVVFILNIFSSLCEWSFATTNFKHKTNSTEIRIRILNCGATDGKPSRQFVEYKKIGNYLVKYSEVTKKNFD
jgi:Mn2+/Fe2+ NRAMP family transporter